MIKKNEVTQTVDENNTVVESVDATENTTTETTEENVTAE